MASTILSLRAAAVGIKKEINVEEYRIEKEMKAALGVGPKPVPIRSFSPITQNTTESQVPGGDDITAKFNRISAVAPVIPIYPASIQQSPSASVSVSRVSSAVMPCVGAGVGAADVPLLDFSLHPLSVDVECDAGLNHNVDAAGRFDHHRSLERDMDRDRGRGSRSRGCSSSRSRESSMTREGSTGSADVDIDIDAGTGEALSDRIPSVEISYGNIYPENIDQNMLNPLLRVSLNTSTASPVIALSPVLTDRTCDTDKGGIDISRPIAQLTLPLPDVFLNMDNQSNKSSSHSENVPKNIPDSVGDDSYSVHRVQTDNIDTKIPQNTAAVSVIHHPDSDLIEKEKASDILGRDTIANSMTPVQNPVPRKSKIPSLIISPPPSYSSHKPPTPRVSDTLAPETYSPPATSPVASKHVRTLDFPSPSLDTVCVPVCQSIDSVLLESSVAHIEDGQPGCSDLLLDSQSQCDIGDLIGLGDHREMGEQRRIEEREGQVGVPDGGDDEVTVAYSSLIRQFHGGGSSSHHEEDGKEKDDTLSELREGPGSGRDELGGIQGPKPGHDPLRSSLVSEVSTALYRVLLCFKVNTQVIFLLYLIHFSLFFLSSPPVDSPLFYLSLLSFTSRPAAAEISTECRSRISLRILR